MAAVFRVGRLSASRAGSSSVLAAALALSCWPLTYAHSQDGHVAPVMSFIDAQVRSWISDPLIVATLKVQNARNSHLSERELRALDAEWRVEINRPSRPLIDQVLQSPLSNFLRKKEDEAYGAITEVFVMDARGLNAGQSGITSDYWQGDEEKFVKSFEKGPAAVFVDQARKDDSTQMLQSQVSITIVDEHDHPIGAVTVGVNLDEL
jgi:hypothetical protein